MVDHYPSTLAQQRADELLQHAARRRRGGSNGRLRHRAMCFGHDKQTRSPARLHSYRTNSGGALKTGE